MTIDEKLLKSVIEEVLKEMNFDNVPSSTKSTLPVEEANGMELKEVGELKQGKLPNEVVIGLAPAFGKYQTKTIIGIPHYQVLKEVIAGIEEERLKLQNS